MCQSQQKLNRNSKLNTTNQKQTNVMEAKNSKLFDYVLIIICYYNY